MGSFGIFRRTAAGRAVADQTNHIPAAIATPTVTTTSAPHWKAGA